jgi:hypothetical protein
LRPKVRFSRISRDFYVPVCAKNVPVCADMVHFYTGIELCTILRLKVGDYMVARDSVIQVAKSLDIIDRELIPTGRDDS